METVIVRILPLVSLLLFPVSIVDGWSNGGYSANPSTPAVGTHDWIVEKAVALLSADESIIWKDNMNWLKYGTELPDRPRAQGGYEDMFNHHVYFDEQQRVIDDAAAVRANETYQEALGLLRRGNFTGGVMVAGAMSHYISDVAVWGHLMGANTPWGVEKHHEDYENYVTEHMFLFDRSVRLLSPLKRTSAYQATLDLASDIMFNEPNATWMDSNYDWNNERFRERVSGSLNLAVNYVANVLHTLWLDAGQPIPEFPEHPTVTSILLLLAVLVLRRVVVGRSDSPHIVGERQAVYIPA
ncbi:zinc dependent phospholipase C family protein [Candidatus Bathyarchaeota archaeon]|nr:zinc dependent phospholipase C family protein [Candidatus Bathyarchaeota archaeon]